MFASLPCRILTFFTIAAAASPILELAAQGELPLAPLGELESRLLDDAADGNLNDLSLFAAALIASGIEQDQELALRCRQLTERSGPLCEAAAQVESLQRVQAVLEFMHEQFLRGKYRAGCTQLQLTLDSGDYNCVTATILFQCLCQLVGLQPQIMASPQHVFCRFPDGEIGNVETTCPEWFATIPSRRSSRFESADREPAESREITPVQLIGKVLYNIGGAELARGRFAAAARALRISVQLDPSDGAAHDNLLAALNNWSLAESDAGQFARAAELLTYGLQIDPQYEPLRANDLHIHQKWALQLCQSEDFRDALDLLEHSHRRRPEPELFDLGRFAVVCLWVEKLLEDGQFEQAWEVLNEAQERYPQHSELQSYEERAIHSSVERLIRQGRSDEAKRLSTMGVQRQPQSERLERQHRHLTQTNS